MRSKARARAVHLPVQEILLVNGLVVLVVLLGQALRALLF
jgi:hypothetical protein